MKNNLENLLLEAEKAFDDEFAEDLYEGESLKIKSHFRETLLSILTEAEKATGVKKMEENGEDSLAEYFNSALSQVKSLWREFRGNLK